MSINRSQAEALIESFLDDSSLGTGTDSFEPKETLTELVLLAGELADDAQDNLVKSRSIASGSLSDSITLDEPYKTGTAIAIDLKMLEHGRYINRGVKGLKGGKGQYSFKTLMPSRKMIAALLKGINRAKKKTFNVNHSISAHETKNTNVSQISKAWGAAVNIKKYGIKPTGFLDKAIISAQKKVADRYGAALKIDILNAITEP